MSRKKKNNYTKYIIGGLLSLVLVLGVVTVGQTVVAQNNDEGISGNFLTGNFHIPEGTILSILRNVLPDSLGASPGPEDTFNDKIQNGRFERNFGGRFTQATNTVFTVISPNATTTPSILCNVDIASTSATTWTIAESVGGFATTTVYLDIDIAANEKDSFGFMASSTAAGSVGDLIEFAPNTTFIVSVKGGITGSEETAGTLAGGFVPVGYCAGTFDSYGNY